MQSKGVGAGGSAHLVRGGDLDAEIAVAVVEAGRGRAHTVGEPHEGHHHLGDLDLHTGEGGREGWARHPEFDSGCARSKASAHLLPPLCFELPQLELARLPLELDRLQAVEEDERADEKEGAEQETSRQPCHLGRESTKSTARRADQLDQLGHPVDHDVQAGAAALLHLWAAAAVAWAI